MSFLAGFRQTRILEKSLLIGNIQWDKGKLEYQRF